MNPPFYGKYRGTVANNIDPMQMGRVQVKVPAVLGQGQLSWAMPCSPFAGSGVGLLLTPPRGANVWVEFEGGDPDRPILAGCFWGVGELASLSAPLPPLEVLRVGGISLTLSALPGAGGLTLEVGPPAVAIPVKLVCNAAGVELTHGAASIKLTPASVSINNGALEVI